MPAAEERTARYLDLVRQQPSLLLQFLREMPKGGDLHNHLSGSVYAESYIRWAVADGICFDRVQLAYRPAPCDPNSGKVEAKEVLANSGLYQQAINALSMRFFQGPESGHDHFFNTFGKFGEVSYRHLAEELAEVIAR